MEEDGTAVDDDEVLKEFVACGKVFIVLLPHESWESLTFPVIVEEHVAPLQSRITDASTTLTINNNASSIVTENTAASVTESVDAASAFATTAGIFCSSLLYSSNYNVIKRRNF